MILAERNKPIESMTDEEREDFILAIELQHFENINNPKINKGDDFYNETMILLVNQKSNWELYYDPKLDVVVSIAVVPGAKSSSFGSKAYFKKWYNYMKREQRKTMLCLSNKAIELLEL